MTTTTKPRLSPIKSQYARLADTMRVHMLASKVLLNELESSEQLPSPATVRAVMLTTETLETLLAEAPSFHGVGNA